MNHDSLNNPSLSIPITTFYIGNVLCGFFSPYIIIVTAFNKAPFKGSYEAPYKTERTMVLKLRNA